MGRKAKKTKTERAQAMQAAMEANAEQELEQAAANAEASEPEAEAPVLTDEERHADAVNDAIAEAAIDAAGGAEPEAEGEKTEGEEENVPRSIVPRKYRQEYKARGHARRCGDDLSGKMESFVQDADGNLVLERVYAIAKANGIEKRYDHLNPGQQRMNIGNILRRKLAEGDGILHVPASVTGAEDAKIAIEPYYSAAQKDAA